MIKQTYTFEIITPCFCGGADPLETAEIRSPSIRGQLRWWFRVLGGFKSLDHLPLKLQEQQVFGSVAGDDGIGSKLVIRTSHHNYHSAKKDGQGIGHTNLSNASYLTFPFQSREKDGRKLSRGVIEKGTFQLSTLWKGDKKLAPDLHALITIFGHLGSLGARSRRAMGALAFVEKNQLTLTDALSHFTAPQHILIKSLAAVDAKGAISKLGNWLKSCRSHGRSENNGNKKERESPYFDFALNDHDLGYGENNRKEAYRPALGLPIVQRMSRKIEMPNNTNNWEWDKKNNKASGRFASPVILRPHRDEQDQWHALVIFVESLSWPKGKDVYMNGKKIPVSRDLYDAIKKDPRLTDFDD